jgi:chitinase
LRYGGPADKLNIGVGLYGRGFTLPSLDCITPRCPAPEGSTAGQWTREPGILGYNEVSVVKFYVHSIYVCISICIACLQICLLEKQPNTAVYWDDEAKARYLVSGNQWLGYDDEDSVRLKVGLSNIKSN